MSSHGSFESTGIDSPITPQLLEPHSQETAYTVALAISASNFVDRANSPSNRPSSTTPPPSSQAREVRRPSLLANQHGDVLNNSQMTPPPTNANGIERGAAIGAPMPSANQLADATKEDLLAMFHAVVAENKRLDAMIAGERMSSALFTLQYHLLYSETETKVKHMEVEHEMTKKEVGVLRQACQGRDDPHKEYVARISEFCQNIKEENNVLHHRLKKAKKIIKTQMEEIDTLKEEKEKAIDRIRQNRDHLNTLRSPGGLFHVSNAPKTPHESFIATPQQYRSTPQRTPLTGRSRKSRDENQDMYAQSSFGALLAAVAKDHNSAPTSPVETTRTNIHTPLRHSRGVQSLSSLPNTPQVRPGTSHSALLPSVQFTPQAESRMASIQQSRHRRRKSRDSTISASDGDDAEELARRAISSYRDESEEVYESHASQSAAEMLRIDPRESFEVSASGKNTPARAGERVPLPHSIPYPSASQNLEKRKRDSDEMQMPGSAKKARMSREPIGLGIGFEARV